jgi:mono/diheme cytochrome c family protein
VRRAIIVCVLALAGCSATARREVSGTEVFAGECQVCHSLIGNESRHTQGGDLLGFHMSRATMTQFSREMPVKHRLGSAQLQAVVAYVLAAEGRGRRPGTLSLSG